MDPQSSVASTPVCPAVHGRRRAQAAAWRVDVPAVLRTATRAAAVTLTGALLVVGFGDVQERRADAALTAALAAQDERFAELERARVARAERTARADATRLTGEAVRYAAVRRAEALQAARSAVQEAQAVVATSSATPDVPAGTATPLDEATARLVALIDTTPDVAAVIARPTRVAAGTVRSDTGDAGGSARRPVPDAGPGEPSDDVAPDTPDDDVPEAAHDVAASGSGAAPTGPPAVPGPAPAASAAPTSVPTPTPEPLSVAVDSPVGEPPAADAAATGDAATGAASTPGRHSDAPHDLDADDLRSLDLTVSAEVLAAARQVVELSVETRTAADAAVAAAQAEREAAEAQRREAEAAARAAAALADRVAATDAAPNGQIPVALLCAPVAAPDALLRCDAAAAFDRLAEAYRTDVGRDLDVVSSYRSFDAQVAVKAARGPLAAAPGRSNHGRAVAVDLGGFGGVGEFTAPAYLWMKEHAEAFGWHHPRAMEPGGSGPQEPWHWEFGTAD